MKNPNSIKSKNQARDLAIQWQHWQSTQNLSYGQVAWWADAFNTLAKKFGLVKEFQENGII